MPNPSQFIMEYDAPFNFGMTVADWDKFYHNQVGLDELVPEDPCTWTDSIKESVDAEAEYWMDKWNEWCKKQADVA